MNIVKVFERSGISKGIQFFDDPTGEWDFAMSATDLADCLGISESRKLPCKQKYKAIVQNPCPDGFPSNVPVILEPGVYEAIIRSEASNAEPFQDWLFEEVIPSIRKTGRYEDQSVLAQLNEVKERLALVEAENRCLGDIKQALKEHRPDLDKIICVGGRYYVPLNVYDPIQRKVVGDLTMADLARLRQIHYPDN